jgi:hypothetical protein
MKLVATIAVALLFLALGLSLAWVLSRHSGAGLRTRQAIAGIRAGRDRPCSGFRCRRRLSFPSFLSTVLFNVSSD